MTPTQEALETLSASVAGRSDAKARLMELVYEDLRSLAADRLSREGAGHTLQPTALVHEAYLRLIGQDRADIHSRTHFLSVAATTMRRVLIDHARARKADKRGAGRRPVDFDPEVFSPWEDPAELLDLDGALENLARDHPRQAHAVELRFFGGLGLDEIGAALGLSRETAKLDLRFARAWLARQLGKTVGG